MNNRCQSPGLNCDDGNPCTTDSCNARTGCVRTNNTNDYSNGNICDAASAPPGSSGGLGTQQQRRPSGGPPEHLPIGPITTSFLDRSYSRPLRSRSPNRSTRHKTRSMWATSTELSSLFRHGRCR